MNRDGDKESVPKKPLTLRRATVLIIGVPPGLGLFVTDELPRSEC